MKANDGVVHGVEPVLTEDLDSWARARGIEDLLEADVETAACFSHNYDEWERLYDLRSTAVRAALASGATSREARAEILRQLERVARSRATLKRVDAALKIDAEGSALKPPASDVVRDLLLWRQATNDALEIEHEIPRANGPRLSVGRYLEIAYSERNTADVPDVQVSLDPKCALEARVECLMCFDEGDHCEVCRSAVTATLGALCNPGEASLGALMLKRLGEAPWQRGLSIVDAIAACGMQIATRTDDKVDGRAADTAQPDPDGALRISWQLDEDYTLAKPLVEKLGRAGRWLKPKVSSVKRLLDPSAPPLAAADQRVASLLASRPRRRLWTAREDRTQLLRALACHPRVLDFEGSALAVTVADPVIRVRDVGPTMRVELMAGANRVDGRESSEIGVADGWEVVARRSQLSLIRHTDWSIKFLDEIERGSFAVPAEGRPALLASIERWRATLPVEFHRDQSSK